jgi:hypothetical protein
MTNYAELATTWYEEFAALQVRIDRIKKNALHRYGSKGIAEYVLKTGSEYWFYRDLRDDRDFAMRNARLNAAMATMEASTKRQLDTSLGLVV